MGEPRERDRIPRVARSEGLAPDQQKAVEALANGIVQKLKDRMEKAAEGKIF